MAIYCGAVVEDHLLSTRAEGDTQSGLSSVSCEISTAMLRCAWVIKRVTGSETYISTWKGNTKGAIPRSLRPRGTCWTPWMVHQSGSSHSDPKGRMEVAGRLLDPPVSYQIAAVASAQPYAMVCQSYVLEMDLGDWQLAKRAEWFQGEGHLLPWRETK